MPARVIAKSKDEEGLLRATRALVATHQAAARAGGGALTVPRPVRLDTRRRVLYLEELPGRPLDEVLSQVGVAEGMSRLGTLHRRLQELPVRGLGVRSSDVFPAVEPASRVYAPLQALRQAIFADPALTPDGVARVRAELRLRRQGADGAPDISRFYWSKQRVAPQATLGFTARTLYDDHRFLVPTVHDFPDEPVI